MFERLIGYFIERPARFVALGSAIYNVACFLVLAGFIAFASSSIAAVVRGMGRAAQPPAPPIAELLPGIPTWWVPESFFGFLVAVLFGIAGAILVRTGRLYERILRH